MSRWLNGEVAGATRGECEPKPLAVELFAGLHGWGEGFIAEGYRVVGFDIVDMCAAFNRPRHQDISLVLQDVLTLHGSQFKDAAVIVASPPCQAYSYRAMPWKRAKALPPPSNELFDACFRIQREAIEATARMCEVCCGSNTEWLRGGWKKCGWCEDGKQRRFIPMVVENVRGAQKWVGRASWNHGSFYLWGDVPALMPWRAIMEGRKLAGNNSPRLWSERRIQRLCDATKGADHDFYLASSGGSARKAASAQIAKIPFPLAQHIARVYKPDTSTRGTDRQYENCR